MKKANQGPDGYVPSNREKSMRASKSRFWCNGCDAYLVGQYGRCPKCGYKNGSSKKKGT